MSTATTPQQYVQDKAAASGSSFYYAFLFLPPTKGKRAIAATKLATAMSSVHLRWPSAQPIAHP